MGVGGSLCLRVLETIMRRENTKNTLNVNYQKPKNQPNRMQLVTNVISLFVMLNFLQLYLTFQSKVPTVKTT